MTFQEYVRRCVGLCGQFVGVLGFFEEDLFTLNVLLMRGGSYVFVEVWSLMRPNVVPLKVLEICEENLLVRSMRLGG